MFKIIRKLYHIVQATNYTVTGIPYTATTDQSENRRLHTGKPFIDMQGLGYYDNNARFLDILTGSFISVDPLAGKYPSLSPYNHCANNPLSYIDPDGRVLRDQNGDIVYVTDQRQEMYCHGSNSYAQVEIGYIFTDNEMPIQVLNNINKVPGWDTNCHGSSFADGKFWINPDQAEILLKNDNYISVDIEDAKKMDKVIYHGNGTSAYAEHSMTIVRTNGTFQGTIVYGLGGVETTPKAELAIKSWVNPMNSDIVRKIQPDVQIGQDKIDELKRKMYE